MGLNCGKGDTYPWCPDQNNTQKIGTVLIVLVVHIGRGTVLKVVVVDHGGAGGGDGVVVSPHTSQS